MKIIEQSHEILSCPDSILKMIELAGRTCYKSGEKIGCLLSANECCIDGMGDPVRINCKITQCELHSSHKFVKMLKDKGHHAMIEFADITVKFITNRGVTHELVRHRLCSFAQESTRYINYSNKDIQFIQPTWYDESDTDMNATKARRSWVSAMSKSEKIYNDLISYGWSAQKAREVLPNSLKTEIIVKANVREWRHIFKLRCSKAAHPQMKTLMDGLLTELKEKVPVIFEDL